MSKNNHYKNATSCRSFAVEVLYKNKTTEDYRAVCNYRFSSCVTTTKALKDVVRRDVKQMGYEPDRIVIKNLNADVSYIIRCRKVSHSISNLK